MTKRCPKGTRYTGRRKPPSILGSCKAKNSAGKWEKSKYTSFESVDRLLNRLNKKPPPSRIHKQKTAWPAFVNTCIKQAQIDEAKNKITKRQYRLFRDYVNHKYVEFEDVQFKFKKLQSIKFAKYNAGKNFPSYILNMSIKIEDPIGKHRFTKREYNQLCTYVDRELPKLKNNVSEQKKSYDLFMKNSSKQKRFTTSKLLQKQNVTQPNLTNFRSFLLTFNKNHIVVAGMAGPNYWGSDQHPHCKSDRQCILESVFKTLIRRGFTHLIDLTEENESSLKKQKNQKLGKTIKFKLGGVGVKQYAQTNKKQYLDALRKVNLEMMEESDSSLKYYNFPIKDFTNPSLDQLTKIVSIIKKASKTFGGQVVIHCGEGMGRTGTVLTYIVMKSDLANNLNKGAGGQCKLGHYRKNQTKDRHECTKKLYNTLQYLREFEQKDINLHGRSTGQDNMSLENEGQLAIMNCLSQKRFTNQQLLDECIRITKRAYEH